MQLLLKVCDANSALLDEVFRLAKVFGKIIDLDVASSVKVFDQLPVTLTNAAGGAGMRAWLGGEAGGWLAAVLRLVA